MEDKIIDNAMNANPSNAVAYGLLVTLLIIAVAVLWRYLDSMIKKHREDTKEVINRNTEAFNSFKNERDNEKKKLDENNSAINLLIVELGKFIAVHEKQSSQFENHIDSIQNIPSQLSAINEGLGAIATLIMEDDEEEEDNIKNALRRARARRGKK